MVAVVVREHFHVSGIPETWKFVLIGFQTATYGTLSAKGIPN